MYIDPDALRVFLEHFEGPLDLLLYLIRKQNLDILTIPIAKITNQYILYINSMKTMKMDLASEYLLMAAMLMAIKSRMLLPKPEKIDDIEEVEDPRQELINRLLEYEKIKEGAELIDNLPRVERDFSWLNVNISEVGDIIPEVVVADLVRAWQKILQKATMPIEHQVKRDELSVREYMSNILRYLSKVSEATFEELFEGNYTIALIVVNFIAILELTKEGLLGIYTDNSSIRLRLL